MNLSAVVRDFVADARVRCPACGKMPTVTSVVSEYSDDLDVRALCHGTYVRKKFPREIDSEPAVARIADWIRSLFILDAIPDVRELLHYNRGTLPGVVS